jgi:hypothetical protein
MHDENPSENIAFASPAVKPPDPLQEETGKRFPIIRFSDTIRVGKGMP